MMTLLGVLRGTPFWSKMVTGSESVLDQCLDGFNGAVNRARARGRAAARRAGARAHHARAHTHARISWGSMRSIKRGSRNMVKKGDKIMARL